MKENFIKSGKNIKIYIMVFIILIFSSGVIFYKAYWLKTPQHSIEIIMEAVREHNTELFNKHVDVDNIISSAYDVYFEVYFSNDSFMKNNPLRGLAQGIVKMAKTMAVNKIKKEINTYVKTGKWQNEPNKRESANKQLISDNGTTSSKIGLKNIEFHNIAYTKVSGSTALVGIDIYLTDKNKSMILELEMEKLSDNTWKVTGIKNMKEYMKFIELRAENVK